MGGLSGGAVVDLRVGILGPYLYTWFGILKSVPYPQSNFKETRHGAISRKT